MNRTGRWRHFFSGLTVEMRGMAVEPEQTGKEAEISGVRCNLPGPRGRNP